MTKKGRTGIDAVCFVRFEHFGAVRRATSIGMSHQEATEMEAGISQMEELLDRLCGVE